MSNTSTTWVDCPICKQPDMRCTTDHVNEDATLIECVNHACPSNIPPVRDAKFKVPPVSELKDALPVVIYFGTEADREEFLALVLAAKPGMVARPL